MDEMNSIIDDSQNNNNTDILIHRPLDISSIRESANEIIILFDFQLFGNNKLICLYTDFTVETNLHIMAKVIFALMAMEMGKVLPSSLC